jgi:hypothetical protein
MITIKEVNEVLKFKRADGYLPNSNDMAVHGKSYCTATVKETNEAFRTLKRKQGSQNEIKAN